MGCRSIWEKSYPGSKSIAELPRNGGYTTAIPNLRGTAGTKFSCNTFRIPAFTTTVQQWLCWDST